MVAQRDLVIFCWDAECGRGLPWYCVSELPKYNVNKYQSPASVATAIDDMADAIVTKATQKAKEAIENAACGNSQTKQQSALE
jgi:hypothetical protein